MLTDNMNTEDKYTAGMDTLLLPAFMQRGSGDGAGIDDRPFGGLSVLGGYQPEPVELFAYHLGFVLVHFTSQGMESILRQHGGVV